jgi:hypothetical protein
MMGSIDRSGYCRLCSSSSEPTLRGFRWAGRSIDVEVDGHRYRVLRDRVVAASGSCGEVSSLAR